MPGRSLQRFVAFSSGVLVAGALVWLAVSAAGPSSGNSIAAVPVALSDDWHEVHDLKAGESVEISVRIDRPAHLPVNGRIAVEWQAPQDAPQAASWRKVLHALDSDVYLVYRAPVAGK